MTNMVCAPLSGCGPPIVHLFLSRTQPGASHAARGRVHRSGPGPGAEALPEGMARHGAHEGGTARRTRILNPGPAGTLHVPPRDLAPTAARPMPARPALESSCVPVSLHLVG